MSGPVLHTGQLKELWARSGNHANFGCQVKTEPANDIEIKSLVVDGPSGPELKYLGMANPAGPENEISR